MNENIENTPTEMQESTEVEQSETNDGVAEVLQETAEAALEFATDRCATGVPCQRYAVDELSVAELGRQGEGNARRIEIDVSAWLATLPGACFEIAAVRPGENTVYLPERVALEENMLCWTPTQADTAKAGYGCAEVHAMLGESCYKSPKFRTHIEETLESVMVASLASVPDPEPVALNVTTADTAPKPTDEEKDEIYHVEGLDVIKLGRQGESLTQEVQIDVSAWVKDGMADATFLIVAVRPNENESYLPEVSQSGNILTWKPTAADTAQSGYGRAEVQAVKGELIRKSPVFRTRIEHALESCGNTPTEPPAWVQQILNSVNVAQEAAVSARQDAHTAQQEAETASISAQEAAASVSGLRGWSLAENADGTVTIDHMEARSATETN